MVIAVVVVHEAKVFLFFRMAAIRVGYNLDGDAKSDKSQINSEPSPNEWDSAKGIYTQLE